MQLTFSATTSVPSGFAAACEHVDAAIDAELMADRVLVEQIFLEIILAGAQLKTLRGHEGEMQPAKAGVQ